MTRKLLIVAPTFPPHPSPATHRARFLTRYAEENGWKVEVLAVDPRFYEESLDTELLRLLPDDLRVTHTPALSPRWTRRFGVGDIGMRAYFPMRRVLRHRCRDWRPDALFIPGGPFYTFGLGADMRREFGIPYMLDYTDPWVCPLLPHEDHVWRKAYWARKLALRFEPRAVRNASRILAVSDKTHDGLRERYPDVPEDRFSAVPFGFEPSDYEALRAHPRPNRYWEATDGRLHLVYVGAMLPHGYDVVRALFAAALRIRDLNRALYERLEFHFFGTTYDPRATRGLVEPVAEELGIAEKVHEHPRRIPYIDALNVLVGADVVLALGSTMHHYTASKIFPCLLAKRPLLAVFHEQSTVCEILRRSGSGELVRFSDDHPIEGRVAELADALERLTTSGSARTNPRLEALEEYSAAAMSRTIFGLLDDLEPAHALSVPWQGAELSAGGAHG
jgi:glycosyltransferase involved in cell wall biosynthesis